MRNATPTPSEPDAMPPHASASEDPAEVYDRCFVPAVFGPWAARIASAAPVASGDHVLDVGCGTGALTMAAAAHALPAGRVVGLDASESMLRVARRKSSDVQWVHGRAEMLPFEDAMFDKVLSQFALMLFERPADAIAQMWRVLRPGGRLLLAVPDQLDRSPGYRVLTERLAQLFGSEIADAMRAPFALGDPDRLRSPFVEAGRVDVEIATLHEPVRFDSVEAMLRAEHACIWTLGSRLDGDQFARLLDHARRDLASFVGPDGRVEFDLPMHVATARKPSVS